MLTHDDGRQPIAIGNLSDSGDLKIFASPLTRIVYEHICHKFISYHSTSILNANTLDINEYLFVRKENSIPE